MSAHGAVDDWLPSGELRVVSIQLAMTSQTSLTLQLRRTRERRLPGNELEGLTERYGSKALVHSQTKGQSAAPCTRYRLLTWTCPSWIDVTNVSSERELTLAGAQ